MRVSLSVIALCVPAAAASAAITGKVTVTADQAPLMQGKETVLTAKC